MGEAGSALVGSCTVNSAVTLTPSPYPRHQVQSVRLSSAAAETVFVVRSEELAGGGRVGMPDRLDGVGRRCQSC